jgi:lipopolysaccharide export LptBFGC system permease protein LptF
MPEEEFETTEFKEKLEEATERAVEASEHRARWIIYLSFTTALIAVLAAIAALESGTYSNQALLEKNEALLAQTRASDQWAYYQAKSVKGTIYASQAAAVQGSNAELAAKAQKEAERYAAEEEEISKTAKELEKQVQEDTERSSESMEHHHRFAYSVTMFQISIALAAVAALSRQKSVWFAGLVVAVMGFIYFVDGFRLFF